MTETILVTGGAGFIGSHLVDSLVERGHEVRVFDNLEPQVHGELRESGSWPEYSNPAAEYVLGDVRDRDALEAAMSGMDVVFHEAAMVGVGQSMYQIERYVDVNARGTAVLLDIVANESSIRDRLRRLVVASSMSIYGEGSFECEEHGIVFPKLRTEEQLARHDWELHCTRCDRHVKPLPTDEDKPLIPTSTYAISKKDQEEMCLVVGRAYNIPTVALRYFNTYGPRQALSNPYTGVAA
ncbi:MAG TPA: SDR family NAD(P)-dependent oxidoreductase, partial [candidate division Zixibacteria bacterium]|nr:SDR family NAD(P)-dependent oxidoreductase [candidate division Zixibacteria bacterium]